MAATLDSMTSLRYPLSYFNKNTFFFYSKRPWEKKNLQDIYFGWIAEYGLQSDVLPPKWEIHVDPSSNSNSDPSIFFAELRWNWKARKNDVELGGFGGLRIFLYFFLVWGGIPWVWPPSQCDHQDYYICSRGFL